MKHVANHAWALTATLGVCVASAHAQTMVSEGDSAGDDDDSGIGYAELLLIIFGTMFGLCVCWATLWFVCFREDEGRPTAARAASIGAADSVQPHVQHALSGADYEFEKIDKAELEGVTIDNMAGNDDETTSLTGSDDGKDHGSRVHQGSGSAAPRKEDLEIGEHVDIDFVPIDVPARRASSAPLQQRQLQFAARNLPRADWLSKSDPMVAVFENVDGEYRLSGQTEWIKNDDDPNFITRVAVEYLPESNQKLKFVVFDIDGRRAYKEDVLAHSEVDADELFAKSGEEQKFQLVSDDDKQTKKLVKKLTKILVTPIVSGQESWKLSNAEEMKVYDGIGQEDVTSAENVATIEDGDGDIAEDIAGASLLTLAVSARGLPKMDVLSKSDPIVAAFNDEDDLLGQTEWVNNNHEPVFETRLQLQYAAGTHQKIRFNIYDADDEVVQKDDRMGSAFVDLDELVAGGKEPQSFALSNEDDNRLNKKLVRGNAVITLQIE